jgi:hypothetical protein
MPRWRVDYLGKKGSHLGQVEATTEREAIEKAAGLGAASARSGT